VPVGGAVAVADRPAAPRPGPPAPGARRPSPRPGKSGPTQKKKGIRGFFSPKNMTWKRARRIVYVLLGLMILGPFLAFVIGWMIFKAPTADDTALTQVATFTFADGTTPVATVRPQNVNRTTVTLDQIPLQVRQAVLAAEDDTFYSNPGFDISGIGRAVYNQLTGGVGGGSTITQQYIKVSTGDDDFSLWRKYKEVVLAVKITKEQTKDQLLENYLNTVYLGRGASGIQAAAQAYFGKDVKDLNVAEGAMLAAAIQSPSKSDPATYRDRMVPRWNYVLDRMVVNKWLTADERAREVFPDDWLPEAPKSDGVPDDDRFHIYQQALAELNAQGISGDDLNTRGLTITTTIDQKRQVDAVEAMKDVLGDQPDNLRAALVSLDPKTGAVQAYYGQDPHGNGLGNDYAQAERQPGSTFKPFVFAAGLQADDTIGLGKQYQGKSGMEFPGGVKVSNSDGDSCDQCSVKTAMTKSINTVFYQMAVDIGPKKVVDAAHAAGIPQDLLTKAQGGIALGDQEVHPVDMAAAFGTFAADGVRHQPYMVAKVVAADGEVLFEHRDDPGQPGLPSQVARNVTEAMTDVPTSSGIPLDSGRPVAAKTGTVQRPGSKTGENKDAWTVGYTPTLSTAVWVGTDNSDAVKTKDGRNVFGRMLPGSIWQSYMKAALKGTPKEDFSELVPMGTPPTDDQGDAGQGAQDQTGQNNGDQHNNGNNGNNNGNDNNGGDNGGQNGGGQNGGGNGGGNGSGGNDGGGNGGNGGNDGGGNGGGGNGGGNGGGDNGGNGGGNGDNADGGAGQNLQDLIQNARNNGAEGQRDRVPTVTGPAGGDG
jgi:membrane peptidoglycan carboxypeptidase